MRIDGEFAYVTYAVTAGTLYSVVDESNPDVFVRLGGRWYDELDDSLFAACQA